MPANDRPHSAGKKGGAVLPQAKKHQPIADSRGLLRGYHIHFDQGNPPCILAFRLCWIFIENTVMKNHWSWLRLSQPKDPPTANPER